jgi:hypothetical protein
MKTTGIDRSVTVIGNKFFNWWMPSSEMWRRAGVIIKPTRRHIPEDGILYSHRRESLKSYIKFCNYSYSFPFIPFLLFCLRLFVVSRFSSHNLESVSKHWMFCTRDTNPWMGTVHWKVLNHAKHRASRTNLIATSWNPWLQCAHVLDWQRYIFHTTYKLSYSS